MTNEEMAIELVKQFQNCMNNGVSRNAAVMACLMDMAEWKDKNPSIETIKTIMCYALKNTNIMLAEDLENDVDWETLTKAALAKRK